MPKLRKNVCLKSQKTRRPSACGEKGCDRAFTGRFLRCGGGPCIGQDEAPDGGRRAQLRCSQGDAGGGEGGLCAAGHGADMAPAAVEKALRRVQFDVRREIEGAGVDGPVIGVGVDPIGTIEWE